GGVGSHAVTFVTDNLPRSSIWRMRACAQPRRTGNADVVEGCSGRHLQVTQHLTLGNSWTEVPHGKRNGEQAALVDSRGRWDDTEEQIGGVGLSKAECVDVAVVRADINYSIRNSR